MPSLEIPVKSVPIVRAGYDLLKYKDSKLVGYEEQAANDKDKKARAKKIAEGKLAPEAFDKAFAETPKAFYLQTEKDLDAALAALQQLDELCTAKFGNSAPSFGKLKAAIEEVRHTVHQLLQKKREIEPDPVVVAPEPPPAAAAAAPEGAGSEAAAGVPVPVAMAMASAEPVDRRDAVDRVSKAAAFLRKREPYSPAPYLMMRGLRWGELRAAAKLGDATMLEAPPTELRQQLKRLALTQKWSELLELAETAMAMPCSRAWLDLQRLVVEALTGLGNEYVPIADAIRSELRVLLSDLPELLDASLLDDTAAANVETRVWLKQLLQAPLKDAPGPEATETPGASNGQPAAASWPAKAADSYASAQEALKSGEAERAFQIMRLEIARQRSGRGRFQRTLQLVQLCVSAGKDAIAQPLLEDLMSSIEAHKLDDWEEKELVAAALATVMTVSKKVQGNANERQKLFERICRLDPVRALGSSG